MLDRYTCIESGMVLRTASSLKFVSGKGKHYNSKEDSVWGLLGNVAASLVDLPPGLKKTIIQKLSNGGDSQLFITGWLIDDFNAANYPIRKYFKLSRISCEQYVKTVISGEGLAKFDELKKAADDIFAKKSNNVSKGTIEVFTTLESDTASTGSIQLGKIHYSKGPTHITSYDSLTKMVKDKFLAPWSRGAGSSLCYPQLNEVDGIVYKPTVSLFDNECYENGILWKDRKNDTFIWLVKS